MRIARATVRARKTGASGFQLSVFAALAITRSATRSPMGGERSQPTLSCLGDTIRPSNSIPALLSLPECFSELDTNCTSGRLRPSSQKPARTLHP
jgi:hypothetical protein